MSDHSPEPYVMPSPSTASDQSERERILDTAIALTLGDRTTEYGDPTQNCTNIASLWDAYVTIRTESHMKEFHPDAEDVQLLMVLMKCARAAQRRTPSPDTFVDMAAYSAMAAEARLKRNSQ